MTAIRRIWNPVYRGWMRFAHVLGIVNTTLLLTIVFVVVVIPIRMVWLIIRKDPLRIRPTPTASQWIPRGHDEPTLEERRHPF